MQSTLPSKTLLSTATVANVFPFHQSKDPESVNQATALLGAASAPNSGAVPLA
jgi:hypothetical protein